MDDEYRAQIEKNTCELVELPTSRPKSCKWIFKTKQVERGNIGPKAKLVAQGFNQKYGDDRDKVFTPVVKQVTLRTLLTVASRRQIFVKHMDVKTANLHGKLDNAIYMRQPKGYSMGGDQT